MGPNNAYRNRLFRAVHVEAAKRKIDHDALHDICGQRYGVRSMSELTDKQLEALYHGWTGKGLRRRAALPKRGEALAMAVTQMISADDLELLEKEYSRRGWGPETKQNFVRRQLRGRDVIRTRRDWARVYNGVRAMNRREGLCA